MDRPVVRKSWKKRLFRTVAGLAIIAAVLLGFLPWLLGTTPARTALVRAVNRSLAPSRVAIGGVSASWFGPIRLDRVTLVNAQGKTLVDAKQAILQRGLFALIRNPNRLGTIVLEGAAVDIERRKDGSIDLVDALIPPRPASQAPAPNQPAQSGARPEATLRIVRGTLRLVTPELIEPVVAGSLEMEATLPAETTVPLSWKIRLANPAGGAASDTLGIDGTYHHHAQQSPDLTLVVKGERWPVAIAGEVVAGPELTARGRFDGTLQLARKGGLWSASGDTRLIQLDASGPALAGDRLRLDRVTAAWNIAQTGRSWSIQQAKLQSPVGELLGEGEVADDLRPSSAHFEANVDLAALAKQVPHLLRLRDGLTLDRGTARLKADLKPESGGQQASLEAWLSDLAARDHGRAITLRDPAALTARATRSTAGINVQTLTFKSGWADLKGSGDLDRGVTLSGTLDLAALQTQFRDLIDFGRVELAGKGRMAADYRRTKPATPQQSASYVARYAAEVKGLKLVGLTAGPVERESARFDAAASGPADVSGLPSGWDNLRINLKSTRDVVAIAAIPRPKDQATSLTAVVSLPLDVLPSKIVERDGQVEAKLVGTWSREPAAIQFDELRVGLRPIDPAFAGQGTIGIAAKGKLELDADNLVLTPLPPSPGVVHPISLAPEGLSLHGLRWGALNTWTGRAHLAGDVAAIDRANAVWNQADPWGLAGTLSGQVTLTPDGKERLGFATVLQVPDLTRAAADGKGRRPEGPFVLGVRGNYVPASDRTTIDEMGLATRYAGLTATGAIDEVSNRILVDLNGTLTPAWANVTAALREMIEPGLSLTGGARPFRVKGPLIAGSLPALLKGLDAELGLDLTSADAFGLKLGPAPLVIRCAGGAVTMDRINSTLNGGTIEIVPGFDVDEQRGIALTLASGTAIKDAAINDEVSRRLLRYVAPVLDEATHVNGRVSLTVERGEIPLTGPPDRRVNLTGQLTFQDVVFAPGPFAAEMLSFVGQSDSPGLKLHQPVALAIADGRVIQKGLEIPVRRDVKVALEGAVGFDQSLDLRASVPLTRSLLGAAGTGLAAAGLNEVLADQRVTIPITGTVKKPRVDRQALQVAVRELSRGMIGRGLQQKATGLLDRIAPPPPPGASENGGADPVRELGDEVLKRLTPRRRNGGTPRLP